jgi:hypothetical protein
MNRAIVSLGATMLLATLVAGCGNEPAAASDLTIERLPDIEPNLPAVPTLPPPPHPIQHADNSYSVFGLRHRLRNTMDSDVEVTGYIVEIYQPPECPEDEQCPPASAPHMWVADTAQEADTGKRLMVVGYADSQAMIDEAIENHERGRTEELTPEQIAMGMRPVPVDFAVGNKIKVSGRFTRVSGSGFNNSEGLVEYAGHETLESVVADDDT